MTSLQSLRGFLPSSVESRKFCWKELRHYFGISSAPLRHLFGINHFGITSLLMGGCCRPCPAAEPDLDQIWTRSGGRGVEVF